MSLRINNFDAIKKEIIGVVGGMGPLASAEFVRRVYQNYSFTGEEQGAPFLIQYSDPSIPDRSTNFLIGKEDVVLDALVKVLTFLKRAGATRYVICCFTIHHLIPQLPKYFRTRIISLVDVTVDRIINRPGRFLFLATTGTRKMQILEKHSKWPMIKDKICFLNPDDQEAVHGLIYKHLKLGDNPRSIGPELLCMIKKYEVDGIIAGCTEIHLLTNEESDRATIFYPYEIVDPLDLIARYSISKTTKTRQSIAI